MANETTPVNIGALAIDCTALADFLVDLEPRATMGMRAQQEGLAEVINEIFSNQPTLGEKAGVTGMDTQTLQTTNHYIDLIDAKLPAARKLVEILTESRAFYDDRRNRQISAIAGAVEARARTHGDETLLAKYEKTRVYRSASAMKGLRTRRKNSSAELGELAELSGAEDLAAERSRAAEAVQPAGHSRLNGA